MPHVTSPDRYDLSDVVPMVVVFAANAVIAARRGDVDARGEPSSATDDLLNRLGNLSARTALLGHGLLAWSAAVIGRHRTPSAAYEAAENCRPP